MKINDGTFSPAVIVAEYPWFPVPDDGFLPARSRCGVKATGAGCTGTAIRCTEMAAGTNSERNR